jgi:hypothetical protein
MLVMRKVALKILPLLVVLWSTLAIVGGAVHLVNESKTAKDTTVKTGLGLCAVTVALLMSTGARRITVPKRSRKFLRGSLPPLCASHPVAHLRPPSVGPPILQLLQVSRT